MSMFSNKNQQEGFSLVETLVAITILLLVIVGPMKFTASTAKSTSFSSEQVVAFFLAQEGVEMAIKARNEFVLADFFSGNNGWDDFADDDGTRLFEDCFSGSGCGLHFDNGDPDGDLVITECSSSADCKLYYNPDERSFYSHDNASAGNELQSYARVIKFEPEGTNQVKVTSEVTWRTGSQRSSQNVKVESVLFDIYE